MRGRGNEILLSISPLSTLRCFSPKVALLEARLSEALSTGKARGMEAEARGQELARVRQQLEATSSLLHKKEQYLDKVEQGVIRPLNKWYQVGAVGITSRDNCKRRWGVPREEGVREAVGAMPVSATATLASDRWSRWHCAFSSTSSSSQG